MHEELHDLRGVVGKHLHTNGLADEARALHGLAAQHGLVRARRLAQERDDAGHEAGVVGDEGVSADSCNAPARNNDKR